MNINLDKSLKQVMYYTHTSQVGDWILYTTINVKGCTIDESQLFFLSFLSNALCLLAIVWPFFFSIFKLFISHLSKFLCVFDTIEMYNKSSFRSFREQWLAWYLIYCLKNGFQPTFRITFINWCNLGDGCENRFDRWQE